MNTNKISGRNKSLAAVVIPILILLIPLGYSVISHVFARDIENPQPLLERPDEKYENCVKETKYMRYHHWELLRAVREEIVRYGIRGDIGLKKCRECHTSRERFCNRCHDAVSLTPDCFGCHYYP